MSAPDVPVDGCFVVGVDEETGDMGFAWQPLGEEFDEEQMLVLKDPNIVAQLIRQLQETLEQSRTIKERLAQRRLLS